MGNYNGSNVFNNASGATIRKSSGKGVSAFNTWTTNINGGAVSLLSGTLQSQSDLNINADVAVSGAGTLQLSGQSTLKSVLTSASHVLLEGNLACLQPKTGAAPAHYAGSGVLDWTGGTISGTLALDAQTKVNLSGTNLKVLGDHGIINNSGTVSRLGTGILRGNGTSTFNNLKGGLFDVVSDGAVFGNYNGSNVFNNALGATLRKSGGTGITVLDSWTYNDSGAILANAGLATKSGAAIEFHSDLNVNGGTFGGTRSLRFNGSNLNFAGAITIDSVLFDFASGTMAGTGAVSTDGAGLGVLGWTGGTIKQLTLAKAANFAITGSNMKEISDHGVITNNGNTVWAGGVIRGDGTSTWNNAAGSTFLDASKSSFTDLNGGNLFKNAGTFNTGLSVGKTTMSWDFTQTSTGILGVDLNGLSATAFDLFNIGGKATLAGMVSVTRPANFLPAIGSNFKFLTCGSRVGQFATLTGGDIDATRKLQLVHNANDVTLSVVSKTASSARPVAAAPIAAKTPEPTPTDVPAPVVTEMPAPVQTPEPAPREVPVPTKVPAPIPPSSPSGGVG